MRRVVLATALALATLPFAVSSGSAAPMSTSDLLRPSTGVTKVWKKCYNVCTVWGYCGYGYGRHRCCKVSKRVCH